MDDDEVLAETEEGQEDLQSVETEDATAASATGDATADTTDDVEAKAEEEEEKPKPKSRGGRQRRIEKLTAKVREQERLIEEFQRPPAPTETKAPNRDDYDDYEKYIDDRAAYQVEQRLAQAAQSSRQQAIEQRQQQAAQAFDTAREDTLDRGADKYDDFEEVATSESLQITSDMAEALLTTEGGEDLWYHLGKNPEIAEKISQMSPVKQVLELGKLGATLKVGKQKSNAPKPTKAVGNRGTPSNGLADNLDMKEWIERRNRQVHG